MLEINNLTKQKIKPEMLQSICVLFLEKYRNGRAEISLVLIADAKYRSLNRQYRNKDYASDILSFPNPGFKPGKDNLLGEIFININEIKRVGKYSDLLKELGLDIKEFKSKLALEKYLLAFIFVHGLLHLLGFDDKQEKDRKKMLKLGFSILSAFQKQAQNAII